MKRNVQELKRAEKEQLVAFKHEDEKNIKILDEAIKSAEYSIQVQLGEVKNAKKERKELIDNIKKIDMCLSIKEHGKYKPKTGYDIEPFKDIESLNDFLKKMRAKSYVTYLFCKIAATHGLRSVDILNMKYNTVKRYFHDNGKIEESKRRPFVFKEQKTSKYNRFVFSDDEFEILENYFNKIENSEIVEYNKIVFDEETKLLIDKNNKALTYKNIVRRIDEVKKENGIIMNLGTHSFRKTFARICLDKGISVTQVKQMMNHSTQEQTYQYAHYMPEDFVGIRVDCD